jgi:hypothetical protein
LSVVSPSHSQQSTNLQVSSLDNNHGRNKCVQNIAFKKIAREIHGPLKEEGCRIKKNKEKRAYYKG